MPRRPPPPLLDPVLVGRLLLACGRNGSPALAAAMRRREPFATALEWRRWLRELSAYPGTPEDRAALSAAAADRAASETWGVVGTPLPPPPSGRYRADRRPPTPPLLGADLVATARRLLPAPATRAEEDVLRRTEPFARPAEWLAWIDAVGALPVSHPDVRGDLKDRARAAADAFTAGAVGRPAPTPRYWPHDPRSVDAVSLARIRGALPGAFDELLARFPIPLDAPASRAAFERAADAYAALVGDGPDDDAFERRRRIDRLYAALRDEAYPCPPAFRNRCEDLKSYVWATATPLRRAAARPDDFYHGGALYTPLELARAMRSGAADMPAWVGWPDGFSDAVDERAYYQTPDGRLANVWAQ